MDQVNILLVDDQPGKLLSYQAVLADLGENLLTARSGREALQTLLKEELREREEGFRLMVENVGDYGIFMLAPVGRVATWNVGAARLIGYSSEEIVGRHFSCFSPREDGEGGKPETELQVATAEGRFE